MSDLRPYPFDRLVSRMFRELETRGSAFDLPRRKFFGGIAGRDASVLFHGRAASTPLGPAAGPHSQMAQNIVLAWLGGSRIFELKTVQILDELEIPRPCIDAENVCYNVEWSQELKLEESLGEYVKASMLIEMLRARGVAGLAGQAGRDELIFDMSVGYDLEGIRSERVRAFIEGMMDARETIEKLRTQIPPEFGGLRDLDFKADLCSSLTLSTFHGCPPDEIERIIDFLLREYGLHCTIKLNPTLLGPERVRSILHDALGYTEIRTPDSAFEKDTKWGQAVAFVGRLRETAQSLGLGLGVKFSNTLIVENHRGFFPGTEKEMYLSGQPLHVLAMQLVRDFRRAFGAGVPVSFSAGIDRHNCADAVALGLTPITVCTDLLRPGGYARQAGYLEALGKRMDAVGASSVPSFIVRAYGNERAALERAGGAWTEAIGARLMAGAEPASLVDVSVAAQWIKAAAELNTEAYVEGLTGDARYSRAANAGSPKKIGRRLELFDCLTCDKCVPVCPNDANFTLAIEPLEIPVVKFRRDGGAWEATESGSIVLGQKHQIANFDDFCNECGNCDVFCPEDGGPYVLKPRFFGTLATWEASALDGFWAGREDDTETIHGRFEGRAFVLSVSGGRAAYRGDGFDVMFDLADPVATIEGKAAGEVDLTYASIMRLLLDSAFGDRAGVSYLNA
ncbi:MAG: glutamate synthase [Phycisphaeraceae bacterium]|nr:MAG: glutamate synthase [Phycisphaeraceae bacterium]